MPKVRGGKKGWGRSVGGLGRDKWEDELRRDSEGVVGGRREEHDSQRMDIIQTRHMSKRRPVMNSLPSSGSSDNTQIDVYSDILGVVQTLLQDERKARDDSLQALLQDERKAREDSLLTLRDELVDLWSMTNTTPTAPPAPPLSSASLPQPPPPPLPHSVSPPLLPPLPPAHNHSPTLTTLTTLAPTTSAAQGRPQPPFATTTTTSAITHATTTQPCVSVPNVNTLNATSFKVGRKLPETSDLPTFDGAIPGLSEGLSAGVFLRRIEQETIGPLWDDSMRVLLARRQLRGAAKDRWYSRPTLLTNWQQFKSEFKDAFQVESTLNEVNLSIYSPPRKNGEGIGQYIDRIYSYLNNFHENGDMSEEVKLLNLKRILYLQLPREVIMNIYPTRDVKALRDCVVLAANSITYANLTPEKIAAEKPLGQDANSTKPSTTATAAVTTAVTASEPIKNHSSTKSNANGMEGRSGRGRKDFRNNKKRIVPYQRKYKQKGDNKTRFFSVEEEQRSPVKCWECNGNHQKQSCPNISCYNCNKRGHLARNCRLRGKNGNSAAVHQQATAAQTTTTTTSMRTPPAVTMPSPTGYPCPSYYWYPPPPVPVSAPQQTPATVPSTSTTPVLLPWGPMGGTFSLQGSVGSPQPPSGASTPMGGASSQVKT